MTTAADPIIEQRPVSPPAPTWDKAVKRSTTITRDDAALRVRVHHLSRDGRKALSVTPERHSRRQTARIWPRVWRWLAR